MMHDAVVLVVGGYGEVGRRVSAMVAALPGVRVIVGGRRLEEAKRYAAELSRVPGKVEVDARQVNIFDRQGMERAIEDVDVVVMCVDAPDAHLARSCLRSGKAYVDISAEDGLLNAIEAHHDEAVASGGRALLSVGLAPGLTNMSGAEALRRAGAGSDVSLWVELGMGDAHGSAAIGWMLDHLDTRYNVRRSDAWHEVRSLDASRALAWGGDGRAPRYFRFPFADQRTLARHSNARGVETWFRLSSGVMTRALAWLAAMGVANLLRRPALRRAFVTLMQRVAAGTTRWRVAASASSSDKDAKTHMVGIEGFEESRATAAVAVAAVEHVLSERHAPGVWHLHQVATFSEVIDTLKRHDPDMKVSAWVL